MNRIVHLTTFQIGTPAGSDEALRIAVTRRPPRGIPKAEWKRVGCFDVWLPAVAPSADLLERFHPHGLTDPALWEKFLAAYEKEVLATAESRQTVALLAELATRIPVEIGCFCEQESHCHRSRLHDMILKMAKGGH